MKRQRLVILVLIAAALALLAWQWLGSGPGEGRTLSGYVEAEALYLSSPVAGTVEQLGVRRGQHVAAGARLFSIEPRQQAAQSASAAAEVVAAEAQADDARKGQRPIELGILEAEAEAARAQAREARLMLNRVRALVERGIYARVRLDDARAADESAAARVQAAERRLSAATLGLREDQQRVAEARATQARARLQDTSARIEDMSPVAPGPSRVEEVFFQRGEWAPANQPIVALIPDDRIFVRFFVPEAEVASYPVGRRIRFGCDGCAPDLTATVSFVSPRPEFTPPIIYSRDSRDRLVFMVEARPDDRRSLVPGLPVDVIPVGGRP
ncbi:MAG TPA: HlyD family efflux transporter periplasmic adaptor subunit [Allosphingosinicella sp.]|nr:HlyD family efflux transporter periplasmic adaptor subunit [Allosphingosinicella sp.]